MAWRIWLFETALLPQSLCDPPLNVSSSLTVICWRRQWMWALRARARRRTRLICPPLADASLLPSRCLALVHPPVTCLSEIRTWTRVPFMSRMPSSNKRRTMSTAKSPRTKAARSSTLVPPASNPPCSTISRDRRSRSSSITDILTDNQKLTLTEPTCKIIWKS